MKIDIFKSNDAWQEVKDAALNTIGLTKGKYPDSEWKQRMVFAEHSPIRLLKFIWRWIDLKSWVSVHLVRHWLGIEHFVSTQRDDRNNKNTSRDDSPQSIPVKHKCEANTQAVINISRRRLCYQASPETREAWLKVKEKMKNIEPEVAHCMVKECVYRNGLCPEIKTCGYNKTDAFKKELEEYISPIKEQVV